MFFFARKAWRAMYVTIGAYKGGVTQVSRAAVEHTIDQWYAECEKLVPRIPRRLIERRHPDDA